MSSATTHIFKPLSVADSTCHLSLPSIFTTTTTTKPYLPIPPRPPIKLHLSFSHYSPLKPKTHFPSIVTFVSSDWAQQEEDNNTTLTLDQENDATVVEASEGEGESVQGGVFEGESVQGGGFEEEPSEDAKLFVGNLSYDVDSQKLAMLFEKAGTVEIAEVIYNRETDRSRGFGFVTMSNVEEAEKAVELFHQFDLDGRLLTVNKAAPRGSQPERPPRVFEPGFRIYVGNLPWDVDETRLEQVFSEHGKVENARVVYDRETGRSRGFGFVTMSSETELNDAIAALDGQSLEGRAIRVNVAEQRPRRSF